MKAPGTPGGVDPLEEIRKAERAAASAVARAETAAGAAITSAEARAETLVREARARGEATAARRYEEGMSRAHDAAQRLESVADDRTLALRGRAAPHLADAIEAVVAFVLEAGEA